MIGVDVSREADLVETCPRDCTDPCCLSDEEWLAMQRRDGVDHAYEREHSAARLSGDAL